MNKKLYRVFRNCVVTNDFLEDISNTDTPLGYTHATSPEKAIANVKYALGIKKKNYYTKSNYDTNCEEKYRFFAVEVNENEPVNEYIIER